MFRCAIVGASGKRAVGHADAYAHIPRGELVAVSSRQAAPRDAFADRFGVPNQYTDYRAMFEREHLDLVHVNTPPDVRLEVFEAAEAARIPALIVEKPLAIQWEDYLDMRRFADDSSVKIAINHQLHFHPPRRLLQNLVADGKIGQVRFIDASARLNLAYQGTHSLQAIGAFNPGATPTGVFAQVGGATGLQENARRHYAPDACVANIDYDNGVSALLRCGDNAPASIDDERISAHKRVAVHGTRGHILWTMWSWETYIDGVLDSGEHNYPDEDILGQAAMTEAMFDWLEDERAVHPLNLDAALQDFGIVLNIYQSALTRSVCIPDFSPNEIPSPNIIDNLRSLLT